MVMLPADEPVAAEELMVPVELISIPDIFAPPPDCPTKEIFPFPVTEIVPCIIIP